MNTVTKTTRVTKLQLQNEVEQLRAALDAERQAHRATRDDLEALRALRAAAIAKAKAKVAPCEETKHEEIKFVEGSETPSTVAEFCEIYCRVNGVKSVPRQAVEAWKHAIAGTCGKCGGTGKYIFPDGGWGTCYACTGKGEQTVADAIRNAIYWKLNA